MHESDNENFIDLCW